MGAVSVTSKGQVTIPVKVRRALGIEPGTKVTFTAKNGIAQLEVEKRQRHADIAGGAGMLSVRGKARSLMEFDAAKLLKRGK
jgi:AbrB family looped-hinge helix DNA binding protein